MAREPKPDDLARALAGEPREPLFTDAATVGTVKWWRDDKGYGAIESRTTAPWDIWCHFSAVVGDGHRSLAPGDSVAVDYYRADQESFRYVARAVRRIHPCPPE